MKSFNLLVHARPKSKCLNYYVLSPLVSNTKWHETPTIPTIRFHIYVCVCSRRIEYSISAFLFAEKRVITVCAATWKISYRLNLLISCHYKESLIMRTAKTMLNEQVSY